MSPEPGRDVPGILVGASPGRRCCPRRDPESLQHLAFFHPALVPCTVTWNTR